MMEKSFDHVRVILDRLKSHVGLKTDVELAHYLDVPVNTVRTWVQRNAMDWSIVLNHATDMDWNALLRGETATQNESITYVDIKGNEGQAALIQEYKAMIAEYKGMVKSYQETIRTLSLGKVGQDQAAGAVKTKV